MKGYNYYPTKDLEGKIFEQQRKYTIQTKECYDVLLETIPDFIIIPKDIQNPYWELLNTIVPDQLKAEPTEDRFTLIRDQLLDKKRPTFYFDTLEGDLEKNHISVSIRKREDDYVLTLKMTTEDIYPGVTLNKMERHWMINPTDVHNALSNYNKIDFQHLMDHSARAYGLYEQYLKDFISFKSLYQIARFDILRKSAFYPINPHITLMISLDRVDILDSSIPPFYEMEINLLQDLQNQGFNYLIARLIDLLCPIIITQMNKKLEQQGEYNLSLELLNEITTLPKIDKVKRLLIKYKGGYLPLNGSTIENEDTDAALFMEQLITEDEYYSHYEQTGNKRDKRNIPSYPLLIKYSDHQWIFNPQQMSLIVYFINTYKLDHLIILCGTLDQPSKLMDQNKNSKSNKAYKAFRDIHKSLIKKHPQTLSFFIPSNGWMMLFKNMEDAIKAGMDAVESYQTQSHIPIKLVLAANKISLYSLSRIYAVVKHTSLDIMRLLLHTQPRHWVINEYANLIHNRPLEDYGPWESYYLGTIPIRRGEQSLNGYEIYPKNDISPQATFSKWTELNKQTPFSEKKEIPSSLSSEEENLDGEGSYQKEEVMKKIEEAVYPSKLNQESSISQTEDDKGGNLHQSSHNIKTSSLFVLKFGVDYLMEAENGNIDPIYGREKEIREIIEILTRKSKNNPILIGDAGVGKTAIVKALSLMILQNTGDNYLSNKRIIELNMGSLIAGTRYRGQFEERLQRIIEEVRSQPDIILFIDEIHTLIGAGANPDSPLDAANMLKPALATGHFRCIGATTWNEYIQHIESDSALKRRFNPVFIEEPDRETSVNILQNIKQNIESFHHIQVPQDILELMVDLSIRFDTENRLPDKAIDLLDKAAAHIRYDYDFGLKENRETVEFREGNKTDALYPSLNHQFPQLDLATICQVLADKVKLPADLLLNHIQSGMGNRLQGLSNHLKKRVIGQEEAILKVCTKLSMRYSGWGDQNKPLGVFLFAGSSGVGKTLLAKSLSEFLFGSDSFLIRIDMSDYKDSHHISRLIGAPPGYQGYKEPGLLVKSLRHKPFSVILLDEIDKAHPDVLDVFLSLFDEGSLLDHTGSQVSAKNTIFVLCANIHLQQLKSVGFSNNHSVESSAIPKDMALHELKFIFKTEFLNRMDEIIVFNPISQHTMNLIINPLLQEIASKVKKLKQVELEFDNQVADTLIEKGYPSEYGAREIRRMVERNIAYPIFEAMIESKIKSGNKYRVFFQEDKLLIEPI